MFFHGWAWQVLRWNIFTGLKKTEYTHPGNSTLDLLTEFEKVRKNTAVCISLCIFKCNSFIPPFFLIRNLISSQRNSFTWCFLIRTADKNNQITIITLLFSTVFIRGSTSKLHLRSILYSFSHLLLYVLVIEYTYKIIITLCLE